MDLNVKFYIGKYDLTTDNFFWSELEQTLSGDIVKYRRCTGLENKGKIKNAYSESYADAKQTREFFPSTPTCEPTDVTLDIVIKRTSTNNSTAFDTLTSQFRNGLTVYWDTQRKKAAVLKLTNAVEVKEDTYLGMKYLECEYKFTNIVGQTRYINDTYTPTTVDNVTTYHLPLVEAYAKPIIVASLS